MIKIDIDKFKSIDKLRKENRDEKEEREMKENLLSVKSDLNNFISRYDNNQNNFNFVNNSNNNFISIAENNKKSISNNNYNTGNFKNLESPDTKFKFTKEINQSFNNIIYNNSLHEKEARRMTIELIK